MAESVILFGATDLTLAAADAVNASGTRVAAIVYVGQTFPISYARSGVRNVRSADIPGWCAANDAEAIAFTDFKQLAQNLEGQKYGAGVVAGWYHMVPRGFREKTAPHWIGFHASLLPQLRGGAPLNWAILRGLTETGVSMFALGDGVDDGALYDQMSFPIGPRANVGELVVAAQNATTTMIRRSLPEILAGRLQGKPQQGEATYGLQRTPEDGRIDWSLSAEEIDRLIRAVCRPYPGGLTRLGEQTIAIHRATPANGVSAIYGAPGQIAMTSDDKRLIIVCGKGSLVVEEAVTDSGADAVPLLVKAANQRLA
ncbi:MAG TPA: formyltransferase family protein [Caulobacterales bacterium]|nr:formyltransferase family protein [Caulobacterales bacterium]